MIVFFPYEWVYYSVLSMFYLPVNPFVFSIHHMYPHRVFRKFYLFFPVLAEVFTVKTTGFHPNSGRYFTNPLNRTAAMDDVWLKKKVIMSTFRTFLPPATDVKLKISRDFYLNTPVEF